MSHFFTQTYLKCSLLTWPSRSYASQPSRCTAAPLVLALRLVRPSRCSTPCTCFHGAFSPSFSLLSCLWHGLGRVSLRSVSCGAFSRACFALLHRFVRTLGNCSSFSCSILLQCSFVFHYSVMRAIKFVLFCLACSSTRSCLWMVGGNTLLYFAPSTGGFAYGGGNCHSSIAYFYRAPLFCLYKTLVSYCTLLCVPFVE